MDAQLIAGDSGVFDVVVDGDLVFSKYDTGAFPDEDELVNGLGKR